MTKVSFIGLGRMGMPMALNLMKANFDVLAYDSFRPALESFESQGGKTTLDLVKLAQHAEVVVTMLPSQDELFKFYVHDSKFLNHLKSDIWCIDCSTVGPIASRRWHQQLAQFKCIDAPVSGGVAAATNASLCFMIGSDQANIDFCRPILTAMGKNILVIGKAGSGQAAKICNNLILANTMCAVSEAFLLGEELELPPEQLKQVLEVSSGNSWVVSHYLPVPGLLSQIPANHEYMPGFSNKMMLKDLKLAKEAELHEKIELPLTNKVLDIYQEMVFSGLAELDFSVVYQFLKKHNN